MGCRHFIMGTGTCKGLPCYMTSVGAREARARVEEREAAAATARRVPVVPWKLSDLRTMDPDTLDLQGLMSEWELDEARAGPAPYAAELRRHDFVYVKFAHGDTYMPLKLIGIQAQGIYQVMLFHQVAEPASAIFAAYEDETTTKPVITRTTTYDDLVHERKVRKQSLAE